MSETVAQLDDGDGARCTVGRVATAQRVDAAMSLIEHEWQVSSQQRDRRIFIEIRDGVIRTVR